jgi:hypothetical protein
VLPRKSVTEREGITALWTQGVQTDKEVLTNRHDVIVKNKDRTCLLIYAAIYKNLSVEIQRLWNIKCFVLSIITGATEIVSKSLKKISGNNARTTFSRFSTQNRRTRNITHHKESTERRGRVVNTPASYSGGRRFESRPQRPLKLIEFFVVFLSSSMLMPE